MKNPIIQTLLLILLFSCTKEHSVSNKQTVSDPIPQFSVSAVNFSHASKLIKQEVSYTQNNPLLKQVKRFSYDNADRCVEITLGTIDSSIAQPVFDLKQTLTFHYEGSSVVPSSFSSVRTVFPNLIRTYYYQYNSQGRKIKDSVRVKNSTGGPADVVIHYTYDNNHVYIKPAFRDFSMENCSFDTLSLLTGGNIERLASKFIDSTRDHSIQYTFTYDRSNNPYKKLNIANSLYFESASLGIGYNVPLETHYMGVTHNNMTSWTSGTYTANFKYLYDRDNYPVRKELFLPTSSLPYQVILFLY